METKYNYLKVIQQNYGQGWEDASEYETNSTYSKLEMSDKVNHNGVIKSLFVCDFEEYKLMNYPTRVINRRVSRIL